MRKGAKGEDDVPKNMDLGEKRFKWSQWESGNQNPRITKDARGLKVKYLAEKVK